MDVPIGMCKPDPAGKSTGSFNGETGSEANGRKVSDSTLPGKPPKQSVRCPYLKPTQVGEDEYPQALERTLAQELGKLTP